MNIAYFIALKGRPFKWKSNKESAGVKKFMNIAYFIALKVRPFTDFKGHIKLHEVKLYTNLWKQNTMLGFIKAIACYLFNEDIRKRLVRVNFIATLTDSTTGSAVKKAGGIVYNVRWSWYPQANIWVLKSAGNGWLWSNYPKNDGCNQTLI